MFDFINPLSQLKRLEYQYSPTTAGPFRVMESDFYDPGLKNPDPGPQQKAMNVSLPKSCQQGHWKNWTLSQHLKRPAQLCTLLCTVIQTMETSSNLSGQSMDR